MQITFDNIYGNDEIYMDCLRAICGDTEGKSMVDIGCNLAPHTPKLGFAQRVYVDILERQLDHSDEQQFFLKQDALDYLHELTNNVDVTLSLDNIEHLNYHDGSWLIWLMETRSQKQVLFTPLSPWMMTTDDDLNPESHRSVWTPDMLTYWASIVFPVYHPTLNIGAWFGWHCENTEEDFKRVINELKQKEWAKKSLESVL